MMPASLIIALVATAPELAADRTRVHQVTSWGVQLQGKRGRPLIAQDLARATFDLLVTDAESGEGPFQKSDLTLMKRRPGRPRVVLSYLSIGEAETYRPYFKKEWKKAPPSFLSRENPHWEGNYKVRYWDPEWQAILKKSFDQVIDAGFDGVYLDIIDAYEYFGPEGDEPERTDAATLMAEFVIGLARHAREVRGQKGFLIFPQNGAGILELISTDLRAAYLAAIDGIGAEDTFFFGRRKENNRMEVQDETLRHLRTFRDSGKVVLSMDYVTERPLVRRFHELAKKEGFVPYAARRALDQLVAQEF